MITNQAVCGFERRTWVLFWKTSRYQYFIFHEKEEYIKNEEKALFQASAFRLANFWTIQKMLFLKERPNSPNIFFIFYLTLSFWVDLRCKKALFAIYEKDLKS